MKLRMLVRILFTPSCWVRACKTSRALTDFVNAALDDGRVPLRQGAGKCDLGGLLLSVENYPFAYGYVTKFFGCGLPSRAAVFRLHDALEDADQKWAESAHFPDLHDALEGADKAEAQKA